MRDRFDQREVWENLGFGDSLAETAIGSETMKAFRRRLFDSSYVPTVVMDREAARFMVTMIGPMMPHLSEECWARLGYNTLLANEPWPAVEAALL